MNLEFFEEASEEVEQHRAWYRERSETAEAAFLRELDRAIELVLESPGRWPRYLAGTQRYVFRSFPFSLVYFAENETLIVVAIAHGKRRPGYWTKRLKK